MLDNEQQSLIAEAVNAALEEFDRSGSAFTTQMLIESLKNDGHLRDNGLAADSDFPSAVTDAVMKRMERLEGPRQLVLLEKEPVNRWGFKDAS